MATVWQGWAFAGLAKQRTKTYTSVSNVSCTQLQAQALHDSCVCVVRACASIIPKQPIMYTRVLSKGPLAMSYTPVCRESCQNCSVESLVPRVWFAAEYDFPSLRSTCVGCHEDQCWMSLCVSPADHDLCRAILGAFLLAWRALSSAKHHGESCVIKPSSMPPASCCMLYVQPLRQNHRVCTAGSITMPPQHHSHCFASVMQQAPWGILRWLSWASFPLSRLCVAPLMRCQQDHLHRPCTAQVHAAVSAPRHSRQSPSVWRTRLQASELCANRQGQAGLWQHV